MAEGREFDFSDLIGYIDAIEGLQVLRTAQGHVYKFVLNNAETTRMKVLIWGTRQARQWEAQLQMHMVLHIVGGTVKACNARYRDANVHQLEFHVQPNSAITILGKYNPDENPDLPVIYRPVHFTQVMFAEGRIEIVAFVRTQFRVVQLNHSTCAQGQVTDGHYRLTVNIADYVANENLIIGTAITLRGEMNRDHVVGSITNMDGVVVREEVDLLPREAVRRGFHPITTARREAINQENGDAPRAGVLVPIRRVAMPGGGAGGGVVPLNPVGNGVAPENIAAHEDVVPQGEVGEAAADGN